MLKKFVVSAPYELKQYSNYKVQDSTGYSYLIEAHESYSCSDILEKCFNGLDKDIAVRLWNEKFDKLNLEPI
jgi:hypothetical protein